MTSWLTADLHLGHANIIGYCNRPFTSVDEMNEAIISTLASTVGDDDDVWILGDVAMSRAALPLVELVPGHLHLVCGNHDSPFKPKGREKSEAIYKTAGFSTIEYGAITLDIGLETPVLASHFPFEGDRTTTERFVQDRPVDDGRALLLHGHTHGQWRRKGRMVDVGVDAWGGRPVSFDEVAAFIEAAPSNVGPLPWDFCNPRSKPAAHSGRIQQHFGRNLLRDLSRVDGCRGELVGL